MNGNLLDYQKIFDCLDVMLFVITHTGTILAINSAVLKRLGYNKNDLVGKNVLYVHPPGSEDEVTRVLENIESNEEVLCNLPILTKDGKRIETETRIYKGTWEGQQVLFGFCSDMTDQRNTEKKCAAIFKNSPVPILVSRIDDGTIVDVNDAWCNLIQCEREDIIGVTIKAMNVWQNYEDRKRLLKLVEIDGYVQSKPIVLLTSYGDEVFGYISGVKVAIDDVDLWITSFIDHTEQRLLEQQLDNIREITLTSALEQLDKQLANNKYIRVEEYG